MFTPEHLLSIPIMPTGAPPSLRFLSQTQVQPLDSNGLVMALGRQARVGLEGLGLGKISPASCLLSKTQTLGGWGGAKPTHSQR